MEYCAANDWPLPIPLMQVNGRWQFDARAGAQEIVDRRIGRNEIAAIRVALTYVDAQRAYFEQSRQGGARTYIENGRMTGGFALLAWPAMFGASGIMTFEVNQDGAVFQQDLGKATPTTAAAITRFDPDLSWARVDVTGN